MSHSSIRSYWEHRFVQEQQKPVQQQQLEALLQRLEDTYKNDSNAFELVPLQLEICACIYNRRRVRRRGHTDTADDDSNRGSRKEEENQEHQKEEEQQQQRQRQQQQQESLLSVSRLLARHRQQLESLHQEIYMTPQNVLVLFQRWCLLSDIHNNNGSSSSSSSSSHRDKFPLLLDFSLLSEAISDFSSSITLYSTVSLVPQSLYPKPRLHRHNNKERQEEEDEQEYLSAHKSPTVFRLSLCSREQPQGHNKKNQKDCRSNVVVFQLGDGKTAAATASARNASSDSVRGNHVVFNHATLERGRRCLLSKDKCEELDRKTYQYETNGNHQFASSNFDLGFIVNSNYIRSNSAISSTTRSSSSSNRNSTSNTSSRGRGGRGSVVRAGIVDFGRFGNFGATGFASSQHVLLSYDPILVNGDQRKRWTIDVGQLFDFDGFSVT